MNWTDALYLFINFVVLFSGILTLLLYLRHRRVYEERSEPAERSEWPTITVLIPVYNEEDVIEDTLESVFAIDYPRDRLEIIVVNDGSTDRTREILRKYEDRIRVIDKPNGGKADALNWGLREAKGELLAVLDSDTRVPPDVFKRIVPYFDDPDVAAVDVTLLPRNTGNILERMQLIEYHIIAVWRKLLEAINAIYVTPGFAVYRTDVVRKIGGWDTRNLTEDIEIAWRLLYNGYKIRMAKDIVAYTVVPSSFWRFWKQRVRWNIGGLQTFLKYFKKGLRGKHAVSYYLIPFFLIGYAAGMVGIFLFFYMGINVIVDTVLTWIYRLLAGALPPLEIEIIPTYEWILAGTVLALSFGLLYIAFRHARFFPRLLDLLVYAFVYVWVFLPLLAYSFIKYVKGELSWFTR